MTRKNLVVYFLAVFTILLAWIFAMDRLEWWGMFRETWPISLTMVFGSFIAGATAEGGGAVAFPVFTKLFGIASEDAKIFSFMIQSFGMTMAGLVIYLRGIRVLWNVIGLALAAGIIGLVIGELFLHLPEPYPKLVFTITAVVFGVFLVINRWRINGHPSEKLSLNHYKVWLPVLLTGFIGGMVSSVIGVGIDMLIFVLLTLLFGINEKISTPTTVVLMGLLSVAGFFWHAHVAGDISPDVWRYWMSCIPIVIFGAPLGAWACDKIQRDHLIYLLIGLIILDFITTLWVVPMDKPRVFLMVLAVLFSTSLFTLLIKGRNKMGL